MVKCMFKRISGGGEPRFVGGVRVEGGGRESDEVGGRFSSRGDKVGVTGIGSNGVVGGR